MSNVDGRSAVAFAVVGHRDWGKSTTLRSLAGNRRWVTLNGKRFFVRLMSNDDVPRKYQKFIEQLDGFLTIAGDGSILCLVKCGL